MALGVLEGGNVGDVSDAGKALRVREDVVIQRHHSYRSKLKPLGVVHRDGSDLDAGGLHGSTCATELLLPAN
nr:hypothetical protein [Devosia enhydra]